MADMNTSDLYAAIDSSKMKINKTANNENKPQFDSDMALYSVLNRNDNEDNRLKPKENIQSTTQKSKFGKIFSINRFMVLSLIITWVILATTIIMVILIFLKISTPENVSMATTEQQKNGSVAYQSTDNINKKIEDKFSALTEALTSTQVAIWTLQNMTSSFENGVKELNSSIDNIYDILDNVTFTLSSLQGTSIDTYYSSCSNILNQYSSYKSGNYIVRSSNALWNIYCDMTSMFGGRSLGWMRVAKLDVNNCPPGLKTRIDNVITTCIVATDSPGCTKITYPTFNIRYTKVAGQVRGYQIGTLDGFRGIGNNPRRNDIPVDGIDITTDNEHVWTFAAGCDCNSNKPDTVGNNYTCDKNPTCSVSQFCNKHLWQSQNCGSSPSSWFLNTLPPTTSDITVRVCRDQVRDDEDLAISSLELYVQ